jgi:hypothetical protein
VVDFKIGIDSHLHYDRGVQVYGILFELLQDNVLMFCISIRKCDGKEEQKHILSHFFNPTYEDNRMKHIQMLPQDDILMIDDMIVSVKLYQCHDLVATLSINISWMGVIDRIIFTHCENVKRKRYIWLQRSIIYKKKTHFV